MCIGEERRGCDLEKDAAHSNLANWLDWARLDSVLRFSDLVTSQGCDCRMFGPRYELYHKVLQACIISK
jgi:hypothetical protein